MLASPLMADALISAIRGGKLAAVRTAVKANPGAARHPKYMVAAGQLGSLSILQLVHRNGSDINAAYKNYTALSNLIQTNPYAAAAKADPKRLASRGNARIIQAVLDAGGDLGRCDKQGRTRLDMAWLAGREKMVAVMAAAK
jgi:hypothetical protein